MTQGLEALGGAGSLASGVLGGNPFGAAGGAARLGSSLARLGGFPQAGQALGALGGPISMGSGLYNLARGDVSGIPSLVSGAGSLASTIGGGLGASSAGALPGAGLAALAEGGAAGAGSAMGPAAAGLAGVGAGLSAVGGVAALGPVFHSLFRKGDIFSTAKNLPTAQFYSFGAGRAGDTALGNAISGAKDLPSLTRILQSQFAPHGEVQLGSQGFGWGGDADDPASASWGQALAALRDPAQVQAGLPWADSFIRNLWAQGPGQTGDVPFNPQRTVDLQQKMADALPDAAPYAAVKRDLGTGGIRDQLIEGLKGLPESGPLRDVGITALLPYIAPSRQNERLLIADWLNERTGGLTHALTLQRLRNEEDKKIAASYTPAGSP
ncbi:MAG: hypothetical protein HY323_14440 [Betaproteobacteria bacterium]|nr:hypothetical protein [Betaproteobacteria bacterium]